MSIDAGRKMNSSSNPSHIPKIGEGFRTRNFRSLMISVVLVAVSALRSSSPTPATQSSTECPSGRPGPEYLDHGLTWAAEQDGVVIAPENSGPLSSPLVPPAPPSGESSGLLATIPRLRPLLLIYDLSAPSYIYVKALGRCYVGLSIVRHSTQRVSKILIDTGT